MTDSEDDIDAMMADCIPPVLVCETSKGLRYTYVQIVKWSTHFHWPTDFSSPQCYLFATQTKTRPQRITAKALILLVGAVAFEPTTR